MLNKNIITLSIISILFFNKVLSEEIPTIVIAPSKQPQSISTVGTSVVVLDEKYFKNTKEFFLGDVLAGSSTSSNFSKVGGMAQRQQFNYEVYLKDTPRFILME